MESLEDLEPVLHTGEGPLAFRKLGISSEQAKSLIQELIVAAAVSAAEVEVVNTNQHEEARIPSGFRRLTSDF